MGHHNEMRSLFQLGDARGKMKKDLKILQWRGGNASFGSTIVRAGAPDGLRYGRISLTNNGIEDTFVVAWDGQNFPTHFPGQHEIDCRVCYVEKHKHAPKHFGLVHVCCNLFSQQSVGTQVTYNKKSSTFTRLIDPICVHQGHCHSSPCEQCLTFDANVKWNSEDRDELWQEDTHLVITSVDKEAPYLVKAEPATPKSATGTLCFENVELVYCFRNPMASDTNIKEGDILTSWFAVVDPDIKTVSSEKIAHVRHPKHVQDIQDSLKLSEYYHRMTFRRDIGHHTEKKLFVRSKAKSSKTAKPNEISAKDMAVFLEKVKKEAPTSNRSPPETNSDIGSTTSNSPSTHLSQSASPSSVKGSSNAKKSSQ